MKQSQFNERIESQLHDNSLAIKSLLDVLGRTVNDVKCLVKHFHMVQNQLEQISNVQKDFLANNAKQDDIHSYGIKTRVEPTPRTLSIQRGIQRESSKILKCKKTRLLAPQRRRRKIRN